MAVVVTAKSIFIATLEMARLLRQAGLFFLCQPLPEFWRYSLFRPDSSDPFHSCGKTPIMSKLPILAIILLPLTFISAQQSPYEMHRQQAIRMNEIAGHITSPQDARRLVDTIARMFADVLPPGWVTRGIRKQIAQVEYESATNPAKLIPEQQVADAWNRFIAEIGAPDESRVSAEEIHYLRDGTYTTARLVWPRNEVQTIWAMPAIYAAEPDGRVADGCRAIEAIRILDDLAYQPENLQWARERARKGILFSEVIRQEQKQPPRAGRSYGRVVIQTAPPNPVMIAGTRYVQERGEPAMARAVEQLLSDALGLENGN